MSAIMIGTGKRKHVEELLHFFKELEKKGELKILAIRRTTKRVMLIPYDELKILFDRDSDQDLELDPKLVRSLGYAGIGRKDVIIAKMQTLKVDDPLIKFNLMNVAANFQKRGGQIKIQEKVDDSRVRKLHYCDVALAGPIKLVFTFRDLLISGEFVDPESIEYFI